MRVLPIYVKIEPGGVSLSPTSCALNIEVGEGKKVSTRNAIAVEHATTTTPVVVPETVRMTGDEGGHLYHVVLLDDDEHTYEYVVEMLQKLFCLPLAIAFQHAVEVDTTGRTIVITCDLPAAEFARDQIQGYGADPRMPKSKGAMSAVLIPVSGTKLG